MNIKVSHIQSNKIKKFSKLGSTFVEKFHVTVHDMRGNITKEFKSVRSDLAQNRSVIDSVENEISKNASRTEARFQEVFSRLDSVDEEFSKLNSKLDTRFDNVNSQFNSIRGKFSTLDSELHSVHDNKTNLDTKCENRLNPMKNKVSKLDI